VRIGALIALPLLLYGSSAFAQKPWQPDPVCGTKIGSFTFGGVDVPAVSNGENTTTEDDCGENPYTPNATSVLSNPFVFSYPFQCTEYVRRFYHDAFGIDTVNTWYRYAAKSYYKNADKLGLDHFPNKGRDPPKPGDIIVFGVAKKAPSGHVAIVQSDIVGDTVNGGQFNVIEQNWNKRSAIHPLRLRSNSDGLYDVYRLFDDGTESALPVLGWLRKAPDLKVLTWQLRSPATRPPARGYPTMAYDALRQNVVLFGGQSSALFPADLNDTWTWDGTNWVQKLPATSPPPRFLAAMAYDEARGQTVLFAGWQYPSTVYSDTWVWDGNNWVKKSPAASPPERADVSMAYDALHKVIVLFGGIGGSMLNDTWTWDGNNWTQKAPATIPPARRGHSLAYDPVHQQIVLFGGTDGTGSILPDTWTWDGVNWTKHTPSNSPASRINSSLVWDGNTGRVLSFGGNDFNKPYNDTWLWDGNVWTQSLPTVSPPESFGTGVAYDAKDSAVVIFGSNYGDVRNQTWVWGNSTTR